MSDSADTIVAIATAPGRGGVGIVRLSGPRAQQIGAIVFFPREPRALPWPSHKLLFGSVRAEDGAEAIDEGLAVRMEAPHSYTGEEVVEIQTHGSPLILNDIVGLCIAGGARLARPGEFTQRAFLEGKLDLVQAEAVAELISATSEAEARGARRRYAGKLSTSVEMLRSQIVEVLAEVEASVDFPGEDLTIASRSAQAEKINNIKMLCSSLAGTYDANRRITGGFVVSLVGRPNVGKSSLFNALLEQERAIVTPIPGTTRDVLREELVLQGRRVRLVDTAGHRSSTEDPVERVGLAKMEEEASGADLLLWVEEAGSKPQEDEGLRKRFAEKKSWTLWNKVDLCKNFSVPAGGFGISAKSGEGVERLRDALGGAAASALAEHADGGLSSDRQRRLLSECAEALGRAKAELEKQSSPEFLAFELRQAHRAICNFTGREGGAEEVLEEIFSKFCIGK